jgi:hypothetical protein
MLDFNLRSMNRRIAKCYRKGNVRERICRIRRIIRQAKYIFPDTSQFSLEKYNFRGNSMKLHSSAGIYMQAAAFDRVQSCTTRASKIVAVEEKKSSTAAAQRV